jgi:hypothetical protein
MASVRESPGQRAQLEVVEGLVRDVVGARGGPAQRQPEQHRPASGNDDDQSDGEHHGLPPSDPM